MGSPWEQMPPDVVAEVIEHLKWDRGASAVFRRICKGWRDAHDERVLRLILNGDSLPSRFLVRMKFPRVKEIGVRVKPAPNHFVLTFKADMWLGRLAGLTDLVTSLDLSSRCYEVTNEGLRILAGLNLESCDQAVSDGEFQALAGFTASPASTWGVAIMCRTTGCGHWPASLPSPAST
jgi:hypothetical protein